jgi:CubicO group peptidase (beta-lactamase class C family)
MKVTIYSKLAKLVSLISLSSLLFLCCGSFAKVPANLNTTANSIDTLSDKINAIISPYIKHQVFEGSILVAKSGKIVFNKGFGLANKEWQISNTAESKYGIGSITKSITAILIMQLVEQNKLSLQDTIEKYLPNLPKEKASQISIHHLLSHTSGLPNYFAIPGWTNGKFNKSINRHEFSKILEKIELQTSPGDRYQYSNIGYFFLAQIIEKITNKDYATVLSDNISKPLGMKNTGLHYSEIVLENEATGYQVAKNGGYRKTLINRNIFRGAGDIFSTIGDLFLLEQALYGNKLLTDKSKSIMFAKQNSYGWNIENSSIYQKPIADTKNSDSSDSKNYILSKKTINYSGQLLGYNSMLTRFIGDRHTIILLGNIGTNNYFRALLTKQLSQLLYPNPTSSNTASKLPLSFMLNQALVEGGLDNKLEQLENTHSTFKADEQGIAALAQQIGWARMSERSERLFKLNTQLFPSSVASLINLAATYQQSGRIQDSIEYFTKAAQLAPDNLYIKQQLNRLTK